MQQINCKIISASAGTGKTYTMAIEYIRKLNQGIFFENILVITFTKKATAEIKERIIKFLDILVNKKDKYKEIEDSIGVKLNYELLLKNYNDIIKNSENIKIFTNDSFINKIFKHILSTKYNIYNYQILEENDEEYFNKLFLEIYKDEEYFKIFEKLFGLDNNSKELEAYNAIIKQILDKRAVIYPYLDNFNGLEKIKTRLFEEIKADVANYLKDNENLTKLGENLLKFDTMKQYFSADYKTKFKRKGADSYFEDELKQDISNLYINEVIIPYNIAYKKFAKVCYEIDKKIKFSSSKFTFSDVAFYTYSSDVNINEIFNNIDTIMIDEFQDTDKIQFKIIMDLAKFANNLFIVGDEKQAIYGFRGGDSRLFKNIEYEIRKYIDNIEIEYSELNTCYRSANKIIEYVNEKFQNIHKDFTYRPINSINEGGYVKIINDENLFNKYELFSNNNLGRFAILTRSNSAMNDFAKKLDSYNIKYQSSQSKKLGENEITAKIIKLLDYLVNDNEFSLLEFLRSDLACYTLEEIKNIIVNNDTTKIDSLKNSYKDFKKKYLDIFSYGKLTQKSDKLNINKLLSMIDKQSTLREFWIYFEKEGKNILVENSKENVGINIMTIHKSKGLEFDTVYLELKNNSDKLIKYEIHESTNNIFLLKGKKLLKMSNFSHYLEEYENKSELEFFNLLYVALTRAKNNLIILTLNKGISEIFGACEKGNLVENKDEIIEKQDYIFNNKDFFEKTKYSYKENVKSNIKKEQARKAGLAIHYFMENFLYVGDFEYAYSKFLMKYSNLIGTKMTYEIRERVKDFYENNMDIFDDKKYQVFTEYEIFNEKNERFVIDRLNIDKINNIVYIFEYKTLKNAKDNKKYQSQVSNYLHIIEKMFENFEIKTEIISI